jgi:hypothetical protein
MEKLLLSHIRFIEQQLATLEATVTATATSTTGAPPSHAARREQLRALLAYHLAQTQAFQHERLVHLLVTFFFALLLAGAVIGALIWPVWQLLAVALILAITEIFYLRHYYALENNTQKLYTLTQRLHELQTAS